METLLRDLRFGARMLLRSPGVTAVAVLALALGIGANSAIFSVVYAVLLRPFPVREPDRLVQIALDSKVLNVTGAQPSFFTYAKWKRNGLFESIAGAASENAVVATAGMEQPAKVWRVTDGFLSTFGVGPALGRDFLASEVQPGAPRVALLSHSFWLSRFSGDRGVPGTVIRIDGQPASVVGVLPAGFQVDGRPADVYVPVGKSLNATDYLAMNVWARLKPGMDVRRAQAEIEATPSLAERSPMRWQERVWTLREFQVRDVRLSLWVLLGAVGLVLLIACANTATLLLARANARRSEVALRTALGAGAGRIARQMLTESTLLSVVGGVCGVIVAVACVRLLPLLMHERLPGLFEQTRVDWAVVTFTLALSVATGLLFGMAPALNAGRVSVFESLKEGGRAGTGAGRRRGWNYLVIAETALALVLAVGATLLIRTFFYLRDVAPGFRVDTMLTARITPPPGMIKSKEQALQHWTEVLTRVLAIPGVEAATFAQNLPMTGENTVGKWGVEGHTFASPNDVPAMWVRNTETSYFRTMQMPLRAGRFFSEQDNLSAPKVILVNETFARRFWPGGDAVGKHVGGPAERWEIVGVVGDVRVEDSTKAAPLEIFFHSLQQPPGRIALAIRADARVYPNVMALAPAVDRAVHAVDKSQRVTNVAEMRTLISDRIAPKRLSAQLIAVFAGLAMILAAVGIYGVLSFSVSRRTHEIGVRVALGARRTEVLRLICGEAAALALAGIVAGTGAALALMRVVRSLVYGVSPTDPWMYAGASAALFAIAMAAAAVPAWRATRVDPLVALRQE